MVITLHDTHIQIKNTAISIFNPSAFWTHIQKFDSKWDQPSYEMVFADSGKQLEKFKLLTKGTDVEQMIARKSLLEVSQRIIDVYKRAYPASTLTVTAERVMTVASRQRLSQSSNHTRQIHYGSKLTDTKGCLLVNCPFEPAFFTGTYPEWFAKADQWALKGFAVQAALYVLSSIGDDDGN